MIIQDSHLQALAALGHYRYLTRQQLLRLGVCRSASYLARILRELELTAAPYLRSFRYGVHPLAGRLPRIYALTRDGAELLSDTYRQDASEFFFPARQAAPLRHDYFHRLATIDFQIELTRAAPTIGALRWFQAYFHHSPSPSGTGRPRSLTRVPLGKDTIVPDAVFRLDSRGRGAWLFALELKNGNDTGALLKQAEKHVRALEAGVLSEHYAFPSAYRVLWVLDRYWHEGQYRTAEQPLYAAMRAIGERKEWREFLPCFAFTTLERVQTDFVKEWFFVRPDGVIEQGKEGMLG